MSKIEWTDETWNPVIGCSRVSEGCRHSYAERQAVRALNMGISAYEGITNGDLKKPRWTGEVRFLPERLDQPRRWKKPRMVFVNSMSDLLHEALSVAEIGQIVAVMRDTPQHTYQVLTKRPERLAELRSAGIEWPDNIWLGVSVENQETAADRIPQLLEEHGASLLWVSYEPALGPVDFSPWVDQLDWVVVGGESGPRCRPFEIEWARSTIRQFHEAGKPVFIKQVGGRLAGGGRKGNDAEKWPQDIRVREYPTMPTRRPTKVEGTTEANGSPDLRHDVDGSFRRFVAVHKPTEVRRLVRDILSTVAPEIDNDLSEVMALIEMGVDVDSLDGIYSGPVLRSAVLARERVRFAEAVLKEKFASG